MKKVLFSLAATTLLFASCGKDDDNSSLSRKDQLMSGKWRMTANMSSITLNGNRQETNDFASYDDCKKDDLAIFRSDMKLIADEGALKCNSSNPQQSEAGTWSLSENDSKLTLNKGVGITYNIDQLDNSTLKISYNYTTTVGGVTNGTSSNITYVHVD